MSHTLLKNKFAHSNLQAASILESLSIVYLLIILVRKGLPLWTLKFKLRNQSLQHVLQLDRCTIEDLLCCRGFSYLRRPMLNSAGTATSSAMGLDVEAAVPTVLMYSVTVRHRLFFIPRIVRPSPASHCIFWTNSNERRARSGEWSLQALSNQWFRGTIANYLTRRLHRNHGIIRSMLMYNNTNFQYFWSCVLCNRAFMGRCLHI